MEVVWGRSCGGERVAGSVWRGACGGHRVRRHLDHQHAKPPREALGRDAEADLVAGVDELDRNADADGEHAPRSDVVLEARRIVLVAKGKRSAHLSTRGESKASAVMDAWMQRRRHASMQPQRPAVEAAMRTRMMPMNPKAAPEANAPSVPRSMSILSWLV